MADLPDLPTLPDEDGITAGDIRDGERESLLLQNVDDEVSLPDLLSVSNPQSRPDLSTLSGGPSNRDLLNISDAPFQPDDHSVDGSAMRSLPTDAGEGDVTNPTQTATKKIALKEIRSVTTESTTAWTEDAPRGYWRTILYPVWMLIKVVRKTIQYFKDNRDGWLGIAFMFLSVFTSIYIRGSSTTTLTQSKIYDYAFENCTVGGQVAMCPIYPLNHTMYFRYKGVYIDPYTENGELDQDMVWFRYDFCEQLAIPKFPSNYQRHCNLMSAGIGTEVAMTFGVTLSCLSIFHGLIILLGFLPWHPYHKFDWILSVIAACCYLASCLIWHFLGHVDIVSNRKLLAEVHAGMKVNTRHGFGFWLIVVAAGFSWIGAYKMRLYVWSMEIELFKYKYAESEKSSLSLQTEDWEFLKDQRSDSTQSLH